VTILEQTAVSNGSAAQTGTESIQSGLKDLVVREEGEIMRNEYQRSFEEISRIVSDTEEFFSKNEVDDSLRTAVDLCIEELFVNMVNYNTETDALILIEMKALDEAIEVSLTDFDVERFDPTGAIEVDIDAPASERTPGGLGLYLVLKMVDSIHYEYNNRQSKITFTIKVVKENV
jgi:anti-sigma regulatory factor (Ser/Thr protein kinase)